MKPAVLVDLVTGQKHVITPDDEKVLNIGRSRECDIRTSYAYNLVSRIHACLVYQTDGMLFLWDNKSRNGTFVERQGEKEPIYHRTQIFPEEKIFLGDYPFKYERRDIIAEQRAEERQRDEDTKVIDLK